MKIHHVPLSYWTTQGLGYLASGFGKPLFVDKVTALLEPMSYARVCVEMSIDSNFPGKLSVAVHDEELDALKYVDVRVEYQNMPPSCPKYRIFGHSIFKCPHSNFQWVPKLNGNNSVEDIPAAPESNTNLQNASTVVATSSSPAEKKSGNDWTLVTGKNSTLKDKGKAVDQTTPIRDPNSFNAIANQLEDSDMDATPTPNPFVSKLKLVDEKEDRELKNKDRAGKEQGGYSKRRNKGRKGDSPT